MKIKKIPFQLRNIWRIAKGKGIDFNSRPHKSKSFFSRLADLITWYFIHGEVLYYYYIYEFDIKNRKEQNLYLPYNKYIALLEKQNLRLVNAREDLDYKILTFDKYVANNFLESIGVEVAHNEALINDHNVYWTDGQIGDLKSLLSRGFSSVFIKPVFGWAGSGIIKLEIQSGNFYHLGNELDEDELKKMLPERLYVVQQEVKQHGKIDKFCSATVNTLRVITIRQNGTPVPLTSFMRIGSGDNYVDNWDSGSLLVGIDHRSGRLLEKGSHKPNGYVLRSYTEHPQSSLAFKGFQIPYYHEAVEIALRVHKFYYGRFILGFDFAVTEKGPVVIEINSTPSYQMMQMVSGGLKQAMCQI